MEKYMGLLRINVQRGVNLAVRDIISSDPYVVVRMGNQKVKTRVMKNNINPEWNEELTLAIMDPNIPINIEVYDKDRFSMDDKMGDAEIDIEVLIECLKMRLKGLPDGTIIRKIEPNKRNFLAEESSIAWTNGKLLQNMCIRLQNVECGELEIQLQWINIPESTAS